MQRCYSTSLATLIGAKQVACFCFPFYHTFTYIHRYRLAPENPFPAGFDDCVEVVKSLLETGDEYGIDTTRIVLAGSSAGGNLAAAVTHHLHNENRKLAGQVGCLQKKCRCFIAVSEVASHTDVLRGSSGIRITHGEPKEPVRGWPLMEDNTS